MKNFTVASMYWINPKYSLDDFRDDMRKVRENRISMLRIFILWEYVEIEKNRFDFSMYDRFFKAAEEYGISVMPTLIFYLPFHRIIEQTESNRADGNRRYPCLDRPEIREGLDLFVSETVRRYKDSPAMGIWNLWNEPTDPICLCHDTLKNFAVWLKQKYPTYEALKEAWAGEYYIFNPILPHSLDELDADWLKKVLTLATRGRNTALKIDLNEFQTDNSVSHMAFLTSLVRKYDKIHPTHSNPAVIHTNPLLFGISPWKLARVQDSTSSSIHPHIMFEGLENDPDRYPLAMLSTIDKTRSWVNGGDGWIGEYQAGSTCGYINAYTPRANDVTATLFHALARGLHGLVFWEWQSWRASTFEPGEFSLRNPSDGAPTERSEATARFGEFIEQYQSYLNELKMPQPRAAVMFSMDQLAMEMVTAEHNNAPPVVRRHVQASWFCHSVLVQKGIQCDFVTELQMEDENYLDKYNVLIMPHIRTIAPETAAAVEKFVKNGGAVWADGRCGFLDKHMFLRDTVPCNGLDKVFGCREADEVAPRANDRIILKDGSELKPLREVQRLKAYDDAEVLAECNGFPAAVRNRYGKGVAELWGTYLSAAPDADIAEMICKFAENNGVYPDIKISNGRDIIVSMIRSEDTILAVFTSMADKEQTVSARLPLTNGGIINNSTALLENETLTFSIRAGETLPFLIKKI